MKSQKKQSQKKNATQTDKSQDYSDEEINEIIADITLKRARTDYSIFISEMIKKEREKNNNIKLGDVTKKYSSQWNKMSDKDKQKYQEISEREREKFKKDVEKVKLYLFKNFIKEGATSYRLFLEERLKEAFENDEDPKEAKKKASEEWKNISAEEKREWERKKKDNDSWWVKAKKSRDVNGYAIFIQKKLAEAKEREKTLNFKDISKLWEKASDKEKRKYKKYADEMNEERKRMREIYEIVNGIKPKKPTGAYKIFLSEKAKEGKFDGKNAFKEGKILWDKLSEEEKDVYLKKSHRIRICYKYKLLLYNKNKKKLLPTRPKSAYNLFVSDMKGKKIPKGVSFIDFVKDEWNNLDEKTIEKYQAKAEKLKIEFEKQKEKFENKIFDNPKRPKNSYQIYVSHRMSELKEKNPEGKVQEMLSECAQEWNDMGDKEKKKYEKIYQKGKELYQEQLKEFEEKGYYTPANSSPKNEVSTASKSQKVKSQKASQSNKKK